MVLRVVVVAAPPAVPVGLVSIVVVPVGVSVTTVPVGVVSVPVSVRVVSVPVPVRVVSVAVPMTLVTDWITLVAALSMLLMMEEMSWACLNGSAFVSCLIVPTRRRATQALWDIATDGPGTNIRRQNRRESSKRHW